LSKASIFLGDLFQGAAVCELGGTTRFDQELGKDRVKHIKSQAHYPMMLGKIERFWKTVYEEFLVRAQFGSFEEAQERIRHWVQYYNHKRPHQGIGGLYPADRYFEIQGELRKIMEKGMAKPRINLEAMATVTELEEIDEKSAKTN